MHKNFLTHDEHSALNDIIFEKRNKAYGAYQLKKRSECGLTESIICRDFSICCVYISANFNDGF